jgi:hypothetical protein
MDAMNYPAVRPARRVRLIESGDAVVAYPVLPSGWAPLSRDQQDAVLAACDAGSECVIFRVASFCDTSSEYRVYRLSREQWAGLSVVSRFGADPGSRVDSTGQTISAVRNTQLIGLAWEPVTALRIATDVLNSDLEQRGQSWRLSVDDVERR